MNRIRNRSPMPPILPSKAFMEKNPFSILSILTAAYSPAYTIIASLMNFPAKKAGMIRIGWILASPATVKRGEEGTGINV
jgi:hypothetical protein